MNDQEIPVTPDDPYLKALTHPFLSGLDAIPGVTQWREDMQVKWYSYLHDTSGITRDSLQFLPDEDKAKNKPTVWATFGSIEAQSGGVLKQYFSALCEEYDRFVRQTAMKCRMDAGWMDDGSRQYLIDPDGNRSPPGGNGMPYGPYSLPGNEYVKGDKWTAHLQPSHRYTK